MSASAHLNRIYLPIAIALLALLLAGCGPEGDRTRGVGDGADVNNTGDTIDLHGDKSADDRIYYQTPRENPGAP